MGQRLETISLEGLGSPFVTHDVAFMLNEIFQAYLKSNNVFMCASYNACAC